MQAQLPPSRDLNQLGGGVLYGDLGPARRMSRMSVSPFGIVGSKAMSSFTQRQLTSRLQRRPLEAI
jgi:hypothetical protein